MLNSGYIGILVGTKFSQNLLGTGSPQASVSFIVLLKIIPAEVKELGASVELEPAAGWGTEEVASAVEPS